MNDTALQLPGSGELPARWWPGPAVVRPMIQLISVMAAGVSMDIRQADYEDPERWWL
jgi:hypothetical protein